MGRGVSSPLDLTFSCLRKRRRVSNSKCKLPRFLTGVIEINIGLNYFGSAVYCELPLYALKHFSIEVFPLFRTSEVICSNKETPIAQQLTTRNPYLAFMLPGDTGPAASLGPSAGVIAL